MFTSEVQHTRWRNRELWRKGERRPITISSLRRAHHTARKRAGLPDFLPHSRLAPHAGDTAATRRRQLEAGAKALDHKSINSTLKYAHVLDEEVVRAHAEITVSEHFPKRRWWGSRRGRKLVDFLVGYMREKSREPKQRQLLASKRRFRPLRPKPPDFSVFFLRSEFAEIGQVVP